MLKRIIAISFCLVIVAAVFCSCSSSGTGNSSNAGSNNNVANEQAIHTGTATTEQIVNHLFPTYKAARQIYAVDISKQDASTIAFLRQLQGLIAKNKSAELYLIYYESDEYWLEYICDELGAYYNILTVEQAVALYKDLLKTVVLYTPETFEFYAAWNDAVRRDKAVCVDYDVASKFELFENKEVIDIRGVFKDNAEAYETIFDMIELNSDSTSFVSLEEGSAFIDYAKAIGAYMLPLDDSDWCKQFLSETLDSFEIKIPGLIFTDASVDEHITELSSHGFGNIVVGNFANSTILSSISIEYTAEKEKISSDSVKKGNIYVSLIIRSDSAGDILNKGYLACLSKRENYCLTYEYPMLLSRLAPATFLWLSVNAKTNGEAIIPDGDWSKVDISVMPDKILDSWFNVNNHFLNKCGMRVNVTDTNGNYISDYAADTKAEGVLSVSKIPASGVYKKTSKPVVVLNRIEELVDLETHLNNSVTDVKPLFYFYSISADNYFEKIPIYDKYNDSGKPDGYYTITEIVEVALCSSEAIKFVTPAQAISYIKKQ